MYSCSPGGSKVTIFSASTANLFIQYLCLCSKLYFSPLFSSPSSSLEKEMSVLLTILGKNVGFLLSVSILVLLDRIIFCPGCA